MSAHPRPVSICVYCGARTGLRPAYADDARALGRAVARQGWRLVYGAGDVGLMGEVARAAQAEDGTTLGVIPDHLMQREVGKADLTTLIVTETMHERKKVMVMNCDAIVVMPGGAGSLDEFFEALTWRQLGLHDKPIVLLNTDGYWDRLRDLLAHVVDQGFADGSLRDFVTTGASPDAVMDILRDALAPLLRDAATE